MAQISKLSRLGAGLQRQVDLTANTLVVQDIQLGGLSGTVLTQTILDKLIPLQNGTDFATGTNSHTHDGRYFTESELGSSSASSGSDLIGDDNTYSNFTPSAATVKGALAGIDSVLATGSGRVKITAADTTSEYLDASITAGSGLSKSITNPGASEQLDLAVNVDASTIEINADALRVKDAGITAAKLASDSVITVKILDANVTAAKLATDSVTTIKIVDANVTAAKLAADSVTTVKILDANVTNAKIATGIDAAKLADGSVSNAELQFINSVTSNVQTQLDAKVAKAGSSMDSAANITFSGGGEVLGLPSTPSSAGSVASKAYVDAVALGLAPKKAVLVATTVAGTLASSFENGDTIDGVVLATGNRILIKDQVAPAENGIYTVNASGSPTRSTDMDSISPIDEVNGAWVPVQFGTANAGRIFVQYGVVATIGSSAINFEFYNPLAALVGGDMITNSGSTFSVDLATVSGLESTNPGNTAGQLRAKLEASNPSLKITGSNELAAKLDAAGAIASGASGLATQVDASTIEISTNALRVKDAGITAAKLASDSVITAKILDANVTLAKLASASVDENKIVSTSVDASLTGGSGAKLSVASSPRGLKSMVAGEAMAANTSFLVRFAISGETAGRMYKADKDATTLDKFMAMGIALKTSAVIAGEAIDITLEGSHTLGASDAAFSAGDIGNAVYLTATGAFSTTPPSTVNEAVWRVGVVESITKIWVGGMQLNGIN